MRYPSNNGQRSIFLISALVAVLLLFTLSAAAQVTTARLEGLVKDATQAVIPGVVVVATHTGTNISTEAMTNETGLYRFPRLQPGTYTVTCELRGFKRAIHQGILLQVGDTATLNITLQTGELTETVTVLAEVSTVDIVSTALGKVVDTRQIEDLPLVSRDPMQLVYLQPGANRFVGGGLTDGLRGISSNVTLEGIAATEPDLGSGATSAAAALPIEAVGEYRVVTSSASAEYGRGAGAQVQVVYRSGNNEFHGSVFDFHRNKALNANSFSNNRDGIGKPTFIRNQFGGSIGGPIIKNKAFFHFTYEGLRQKTDSTPNGLVYTDTFKKTGIFRYYTKGPNSTSLVDRVTGIPNVPESDIATLNLLTIDPGRAGKDPSGLFDKLVGSFPAPNNYDNGDGFNTAGYRYVSVNTNVGNQFVLKGDYVLTSKHRISFTHSWSRTRSPGTLLLNGQRGTYRGIETTPTGVLAVDSTLAPNWLNEFRVGGTKRDQNSVNPDDSRFDPKGSVVFAGLGAPGRSDPLNIGLMDIFSPAVITIADNMTWIKGNHSIRGGIDLRINRDQVKYGDDYWIPVIDTGYANNSPTFPASIPNLNTTDRTRALQLTNDLTGSVGQIRQVFNANSKTAYTPFEVPYRRFRAKEWSFFLQDTYKLRPNLTLNLGVRYEVMPPQYEYADLYAYPVGGPIGVLGISGPGGETKLGLAPNRGKDVYNTDWNNIAPNVGFNWDPFNDGKWSISANYRLSYDRHYFTNTLFTIISQEGSRTDRTIYGSAGMRLTVLPSLFNSTTGYFDPGVPFGPKAYNRQGLVQAWDPGYYLPYTGGWSLRIQREIVRKMVLSVSYVGNKVTGQQRAVDLNQLEIRQNGFLNGFLAAQRNLTANGDPMIGEATGAFGQLYAVMSSSHRSSVRNNLLTGAVATAADYIDRTQVSSNYLGKAGLPITFFRINPQFQGAWLNGNNSNSTYHAMKLEVSKRFSEGLQFDMNYTFSKSLTDYMGGQSQRDAYRDNANRQLDKTYASSDARHVINANFIWELPVGTGRRFMNAGNPIVNGILGGWQLNGIFGYSSGRPMTASSGYNKLTTGDASTANCSGCDPYMSSKIIKNSPDGRLYGLTADEMKMLTQPATGSAGLTSQYYFRGPSSWSADGSVFKVFRLPFLGEQGSLQSRFEFINAFNNTRFGSPTLTLTSTSFGQITAPTGNFRIIQVALKILF